MNLKVLYITIYIYISIRSKKTKGLDLCFHKVDRYSFIKKKKSVHINSKLYVLVFLFIIDTEIELFHL